MAIVGIKGRMVGEGWMVEGLDAGVSRQPSLTGYWGASESYIGRGRASLEVGRGDLKQEAD